MCIHLTNNPARFHPDPIWSCGALGFFGRGRLKQEQEEQEQDE